MENRNSGPCSPTKAIETSYKGYRFRSRLEARWAVFFDELDIDWEYEPEGFELPGGHRYLPDFRLILQDAWFEVKGPAPTELELHKLQLLCEATGKQGYLAYGNMGLPDTASSGSNIIRVRSDRAANFTPVWVNEDGEQLLACHIKNGFYENDAGAIGLDHLYSDDVPISGTPITTHTSVQFFQGGTGPMWNIGTGRLYRSKRIADAYSAARGARFEHGESGARRA